MKTLTLSLFLALFALAAKNSQSQTSESTRYEYQYDQKNGFFKKVQTKTITTETIVEQQVSVPSSILAMNDGAGGALTLMNGRSDSIITAATPVWSYNPFTKSFWHPVVIVTSFKFKEVWSQPIETSISIHLKDYYTVLFVLIFIFMAVGGFFHEDAGNIYWLLGKCILFSLCSSVFVLSFGIYSLYPVEPSFPFHSVMFGIPTLTLAGYIGVKIGNIVENLQFKARIREYHREEQLSTE